MKGVVPLHDVKKVSKMLYLWSAVAVVVVIYIISFIVGWEAGSLSVTRNYSSDAFPRIVILTLIALFLIAYFAVIEMVLLYKAWAAIRPVNPRMTPGKAVGFSFIPFYNLYWLFPAFWGLAKDYNSYINKTGAADYRLNEGMFVTYCILVLSMLIPIAGYLTLIPGTIINFMVINQMCNGINHLAEGKTMLAQEPVIVEGVTS